MNRPESRGLDRCSSTPNLQWAGYLRGRYRRRDHQRQHIRLPDLRALTNIHQTTQPRPICSNPSRRRSQAPGRYCISRSVGNGFGILNSGPKSGDLVVGGGECASRQPGSAADWPVRLAGHGLRPADRPTTHCSIRAPAPGAGTSGAGWNPGQCSGLDGLP